MGDAKMGNDRDFTKKELIKKLEAIKSRETKRGSDHDVSDEKRKLQDERKELEKEIERIEQQELQDQLGSMQIGECKIKDQKEKKALKTLFYSTEISPSKNLPKFAMVKERKYSSLNNNLIHNSIINKNTSLAEICCRKAPSEDALNEVSYSNTPLLLALKHGNIKVALALLSREKVNVNTKDVNGLSALDWACMLRQNELIRSIMNHPTFKTEGHENAAALYIDEVNHDAFKKYLDKCFNINGELDRNNVAQYFSENKGMLEIPNAPAYSDLIFFINHICINLGWKKESDFPDPQIRHDLLCSHMMHREYFKIAYKDFCENRNAIKISSEITDQLIKIATGKHDLRSSVRNLS